MTRTEDRLRDALTGAAEMVRRDSLDPLDVTVRRRIPMTGRWLVPASAAVSILALITVSFMLLRPGMPDRGVPLSGGQSSAGPRYIVAIERGERLSVYDAVTGKERDAIERPDRLERFEEVAATGDPRTFIVAGPLEGARKSTIYRLRLAADGDVDAVEPLVTVTGWTRDLTVTDDGTRAAYTCGDWCANVDEDRLFDRLTVVDLRTGETRRWTGNDGSVATNGSSADVSWTADGHEVAFVWNPESYTESRTEIRVLDTRARGRDLLSSSVVLSNERLRQLGRGLYQMAISPDGDTILAAFAKARWEVSRPGKQAAILRLSAENGKPLEVVATFPPGSYPPFFEMDASGRHLLLYRGDTVGRFDDGKFRPLFQLRGTPADFAW